LGIQLESGGYSLSSVAAYRSSSHVEIFDEVAPDENPDGMTMDFDPWFV
jgi:hypothetical protein